MITGLTEIEKKIVKSGKEKEEAFNLGKDLNWRLVFGKDKFKFSWLLPFVNTLPSYSSFLISLKQND